MLRSPSFSFTSAKNNSSLIEHNDMIGFVTADLRWSHIVLNTCNGTPV